ncbi:MAG: pentapeptide repeat-containing protein [Planctomycetota bacterium]
MSDPTTPPTQYAQTGNVLAFQTVLTPTEKRSLRRKVFRSLTFEHVDFSGADFRLSHFSNVTFLRCDLSGADLRLTELQGCRFIECELASLRLGRNRFSDTDFRNCRRLSPEHRRLVLSMGGRWIGSLRE